MSSIARETISLTQYKSSHNLDIPSWFLKKPSQKFEIEWLIMLPTMVGRQKTLKYKFLNINFIQKLKQNTVFSFLLPLINSDIMLQDFRVTFCFNFFQKDLSWREFLKKSTAIYNRIKCVSLKIGLERFQNNIFVELKTVMFFIAFEVLITINDRVK